MPLDRRVVGPIHGVFPFCSTFLRQRIAAEFLQFEPARLDQRAHHQFDRAEFACQRRRRLVIRRLGLIVPEAQIEFLRPFHIRRRGPGVHLRDSVLQLVLEGHRCARDNREHPRLQFLLEGPDFFRHLLLLREQLLEMRVGQRRLGLLELFQIRRSCVEFADRGVVFVHPCVNEIAKRADAHKHRSAKAGHKFVFGNPAHWIWIGLMSFNGSTYLNAQSFVSSLARTYPAVASSMGFTNSDSFSLAMNSSTTAGPALFPASRLR